MFRNLFLAALCAAICAGVVTSVFQAWRVTPLIFAAETYEAEAAAEPATTAPAEHGAHQEEWAPQDGFERTAYTVLANLLLAAGYALVIGAASLLLNLPITAATGLLWGLGGFAAFSLAPSLGLPPGMPGMPVADTFARQLWWAGAAISTGAGLVVAARFRSAWALAAAVALILLPQLIPAPQPPIAPTDVPPRLAAAFVAAVLYNGVVFWAVLGLAFGAAASYLAARPSTALKGAAA